MQDQSIPTIQMPPTREASSNLAPDDFRALGHDLVDRIADFQARLPTLPVT